MPRTETAESPAPGRSPATPPPAGGDRAPADVAPTPDGPDAVPYAGRWLVLAFVVIADVMDLVDASITNVSGPVISQSLGGGETLVQWLGAGYTLAIAVFLITGAKLGDLHGRRRVFLVGAVGFTAASALCAAAWSPESLIAFRVLQGALGALMIPQGFAMMTEVLRGKDMERAFAVFGPIMGLSAIAGPILGAALLDADVLGSGWRSIFLINVPLGVAAVWLAARWAPRSVPTAGGRLDPLGVVLIGLAGFALIYPLIEGRELGWPLWSFVLFAAGLLLLAVFVRQQRGRRPEDALVQVTLMRRAEFRNGMAAATTFFLAFAGLVLAVTLFWQVGEGRSPSGAAIAAVPMSIGLIVGMVGSFALVERLGRKLIQIGTVVTAAGAVVAAAVMLGQQDPSAWLTAGPLVLIGIGAGAVLGQLFDVVLAGVADHEVGSASGVLNALQQLATALGVAILGTVFFDRLAALDLPADAFAVTALCMLVPLAVTFALAFTLPPKARAEGAH